MGVETATERDWSSGVWVLLQLMTVNATSEMATMIFDISVFLSSQARKQISNVFLREGVIAAEF